MTKIRYGCFLGQIITKMSQCNDKKGKAEKIH